MTSLARKAPKIGGLGLILLCFAGSGALRLSSGGALLAEEIANRPVGEQDSAALRENDTAAALLAAIQEREAQLDAEAERLSDRAQTLSVAETRLAEQLEAFEEAQARLEETLALADQAAERDIERLTSVYEAMKPDDAARIFERMEVQFAAGLLARMQPDIAADVLTGMEPDTAYALTLTVASRRVGVPTE